MKRMLKVTALMSSTTLINIFLNTIKIKVMSALIGTAGMGVFSLFQSIYNVLLSIGGVVAGGSVVKSVAETRSENNNMQLQILQFLLVRVAVFVGLSSGLILYFSSNFISIYVFNDVSYHTAIKWMSLLPIIINLSLFWQSWLNGLRQVKKLIKIKLFSSFLITLFSIIFIYIFHEDGIVYIILFSPIPLFIVGRYYSHSLGKPTYTIDTKNIKEVLKVIKLGLILVIMSLIFQFGVINARSLITEFGGVSATGIVFASWAISMSYIEIFLSALSVEYYPKLVEIKGNLNATNKLINNQIYLLLMIIFPVLIILYIFSPFLIPILYSSEFNQASSILRYQLIGDVFKVISWIFGYVLIVNGYLKTSLLLQIQWVLLYLILLNFGLNSFGLDIAGIAFISSYLASSILSYFVLKVRINFTFSKENKLLLTSIIIISTLLIILHYFSIVSTYLTIIELLIALYYTSFFFKEIRNKIKINE